MSDTEESTIDSQAGQKSGEQQLQIKVDNVLYKIVDNHISVLKLLKQTKATKNEWLLSALKEKLEREKVLSPSSIPKEKHITVKLGKELQEVLEARISVLDRITRGYSKKRFFLEAILEKIEHEKATVAGSLKEQEKKLLEDPDAKNGKRTSDK